MFAFFTIHKSKILLVLGLAILAMGYFYNFDFGQGFGAGVFAGGLVLFIQSYFNKERKTSTE
jgi:hypothetical protein